MPVWPVPVVALGAALAMATLMIMKLRDDWLAVHPGSSLRDFHDAFLGYGSSPVVLLRKAMLGDADDNRLFN